LVNSHFFCRREVLLGRRLRRRGRHRAAGAAADGGTETLHAATGRQPAATAQSQVLDDGLGEENMVIDIHRASHGRIHHGPCY